MLLKPGGMRKNSKREKDSAINTRKMEMTGKNTFVVHADGGNHFEGKITNPDVVKFRGSGKLTFTSVCIKKCFNRNKKCDTCYRFSELKGPSNACN